MNRPQPPSSEATSGSSDRSKIRIDQWLWFARFAKSRSLAGRLCAGGAIVLNDTAVSKPTQSVRVGDIVVFPQGPRLRTVRVLALGNRRGPAPEARMLYEETAPAVRPMSLPLGWVPLIDDTEAEPNA